MTFSFWLGVGFIIIGVFGVCLLLFVLAKKVMNPADAGLPSSIAAHQNEAQQKESEEMRVAGFEKKLAGLGAAAAAIFSVLIFKLWSMQLISREDYEALAHKNKTRQIPIKAPRGRILDRNGEVIVGNRPTLVLTADKQALQDPLLLKRLANVLGMPLEVVRRHIQDESQGASAPRLVAMDLSMKTVSYLIEHPQQFPHTHIESRSVRAYPHGSLAAHILGYTGTISQEELAQNKAEDDPRIRYEMGDVVGKTGVEYQYESVLQGISGSHIIQVDAHGKLIDFVEEVPAIPGSDIQLSIDIKIQHACEKYLREAIRIAKNTGRRTANAGATAVMEVKTGKIVAMASYPSFDPSVFVGGIDAQSWENLTAQDSYNPLSNRVISGLYPMASTIKPFSALSALDFGIATAESSYMCSGRWKGFGERWAKWCWEHRGHGPQNIRQGIVNSCDTVFYEIGKAFSQSDNPEGLQKTYREWGLGKKTEIDLPGEAQGRIPDAAWKYAHFSKAAEQDRRWQAGDTVNMVIGQGDVLVTPLQVLTSYCALANGGKLLKPSILDKVLSKDALEGIIHTESSVRSHITVEQSYLDLVLSGLKGVVAETSMSAYYRSMKTQIAGKTGTAEVANKGDYAWFVGFGPFEDPEYACVLIVEQGGGGGTAAAPAVRQIFGEIFNEPMPEIKVKEDRTR